MNCGIITKNPSKDIDAELQVNDTKTKNQEPYLISDDVNGKKKSLEEDIQQPLTKNRVIRFDIIFTDIFFVHKNNIYSIDKYGLNIGFNLYRSLDDLLYDLSGDKKAAKPLDDTTPKIQTVDKTTEVQACVAEQKPKNKSHREGVRMTSAALRREMHIKKKNELRNKLISKY